jgi:hypothetical protein
MTFPSSFTLSVGGSASTSPVGTKFVNLLTFSDIGTLASTAPSVNPPILTFSVAGAESGTNVANWYSSLSLGLGVIFSGSAQEKFFPSSIFQAVGVESGTSTLGGVSNATITFSTIATEDSITVLVDSMWMYKRTSDLLSLFLQSVQ